MAKKKNTRNKAKKSQDNKPVEPTRRNVMRTLGLGALGALGVGGAGWFAVSAVRATAAEMDLSRVGQGKPTVVQVHDPSCPMCTQLQRETRAALSCFEECDVIYLVANINGDEGRQFATRYGVPHVTLLLFDGAGELQQELRGVRQSEDLKPVFEALRDTV